MYLPVRKLFIQPFCFLCVAALVTFVLNFAAFTLSLLSQFFIPSLNLAYRAATHCS